MVMKTFLKRNRMIKLFTIGWIFAMFIIAAILLFGAPLTDKADPAAALISGEDKMEVIVIVIPPSALLNPVVITNSSCSIKATALTLMSGKTYKSVTFISIDGYDINCAVIAEGGSADESDYGGIYSSESSPQGGLSYIGGVIDPYENNLAGTAAEDNLSADNLMFMLLKITSNKSK